MWIFECTPTWFNFPATTGDRHGLPHFTEETVAQTIGDTCLGSQNKGPSGSKFSPEANEGFKGTEGSRAPQAPGSSRPGLHSNPEEPLCSLCPS